MSETKREKFVLPLAYAGLCFVQTALGNGEFLTCRKRSCKTSARRSSSLNRIRSFFFGTRFSTSQYDFSVGLRLYEYHLFIYLSSHQRLKYGWRANQRSCIWYVRCQLNVFVHRPYINREGVRLNVKQSIVELK